MRITYIAAVAGIWLAVHGTANAETQTTACHRENGATVCNSTGGLATTECRYGRDGSQCETTTPKVYLNSVVPYDPGSETQKRAAYRHHPGDPKEIPIIAPVIEIPLR